MVLKIYGDFMSQPFRAVVLFCLENKIAHQVETIQIAKGQHRKEEFAKVNPLRYVPAIDDDGFRLYESHAILQYLAATRKVADHWYPSDPKQRAAVDKVLHWHHSNLRLGSSWLVFNKVLGPRMGVTADPAIIQRAQDTLTRSLTVLNQVFLAGSNYVAGSQISIADLSLACEIISLFLIQFDFTPYPNIVAWLERIKQLPHWNEVNVVFNKVLASTTQAAAAPAKKQVKVSPTSGSSPAAAAGAGSLLSTVVFDEIQKRLPQDGPEMVKQLGCVFRFEVTGKDANGAPKKLIYTADLKNGSGSVTEGESKLSADTTFVLSDDDFIALAVGKLNPQMAFMNGKMKVKGNLAKALKFDAVVLKKRGKEIREVLGALPAAKL